MHGATVHGMLVPRGGMRGRNHQQLRDARQCGALLICLFANRKTFWQHPRNHLPMRVVISLALAC